MLVNFFFSVVYFFSCSVLSCSAHTSPNGCSLWIHEKGCAVTLNQIYCSKVKVCQRSLCEIIVWSIFSFSYKSYLKFDHHTSSSKSMVFIRGFECLWINFKVKVKALIFFTSPFHPRCFLLIKLRPFEMATLFNDPAVLNKW